MSLFFQIKAVLGGGNAVCLDDKSEMEKGGFNFEVQHVVAEYAEYEVAVCVALSFTPGFSQVFREGQSRGKPFKRFQVSLAECPPG
jgi:hypothetical protein